MADVWNVFNQSLEFGMILDSTTSHYTGSWFLTFMIIVFMMVLIAGFFRMPEVLYLIAIIPVVLIFSTIDIQFRMFTAVIAIFMGYLLYQILPWR